MLKKEIKEKNMNFILIGMPGSGKSTVGVILAKMLSFDFIDSDLVIQKRAGMPLQQIINTKGNDYFSKLENDVNASLDVENTVIATGGSAIFCEGAMEHFRKIGKILYIKITCDEMQKRITNPTSRGIVLKDGQTLADMYKQRTPYYEKYADITFDWTRGTAGDAAEEIKKVIESYR